MPKPYFVKIIATLNSFFLLVLSFMAGCHEGPALETKQMPVVSHAMAARNVMPDTVGWASEALRILKEQEYAITYNETAKHYFSPNRRQHMQAMYTSSQLTLASEAGSPRNWTMNLQLQGIYAGSVLQYDPSTTARAKVEGNTIEFDHHGAFTVQYINSQEGVRQNFIVQQQPATAGNLAIQLSVNEGWTIKQADSGELHFLHRQPGGELRKELTYHSLKVWDAQHKALEAWSKVNEDHSTFTIEVDTKDAIYPVTIDPLSTTADWEVYGSRDDYFGGFINSAGDVNGDGYGDVIVGESQYSDPSVGGAVGRVYVYYGSESGLPLTADWVATGTVEGAVFGEHVASAGDVNGDGYGDVIIGAVGESGDQQLEGAAYIYYGSASGLESSPAWRVEGNLAYSAFAESVDCAGDVNGDGYSDVIVTNPEFSIGGTGRAGIVYIYYGGPDGVSETPDVSLEGTQQNELFGQLLGAAGDVNGDGYSDVVIGSPYYDVSGENEGRVQIYYGSASGITASNRTDINGTQPNMEFGQSASVVGDVNGDGFADVLVGVPEYANGENDEGAVFLYYGSAAGIVPNHAWYLESNMENREFGSRVRPAGDVDGDGLADVLIFTFGYDTAYVYKGSPDGLENTPAWKYGRDRTAENGISGAGAGDVNGDGYSDVLVGFPTEGYVRGFFGGADGLETNADVNLTTNQEQANTGFGVSSAGDINGDGYGDVVVGVPGYSNGEEEEGALYIYYGTASGIPSTPSLIIESNSTNARLGNSVAGAGDVNGDGYADVIAGAFHYGVFLRGAAFIYYGSPSGLNPTPAWTAQGTGNSYEFGHVVAGIGDVNGDGYADVGVGSPWPLSNTGAVYVYYGSASGPSATANWQFSGLVPGTFVGYTVSAAGDVNGDGFDDMVLSAPFLDIDDPSVGHIHIFHGSNTGLPDTPTRTIEGGSANGAGFIVTGAGDLNGDGFSDLVVGDPQYNNIGRICIYYGSSSGIPLGVFHTIDINKNGSLFGTALASAGDVNGDGYSDLIVSAPELTNDEQVEGGAYVYLGGLHGISSTTPHWQIEGNQDYAYLGWSVSGAGDINGDGLSDIIIGAPGINDPQEESGRAMVFLGNAGGLRNNLRLYNTDLSTPIQQSNLQSANFGAGFFAKSFMGRGKARVIWEAQPEGRAFGSTNHGGYKTGKTDFIDLGAAGTEIKTLIDKAGKQTKLRVRLEYEKRNSINGQVMGPWRYPAGYLQGVGGMSNTPLPIKLERFTAKYQPTGDVLLEWRSAMEENSYSFEIQRSLNGRDFTTIGQVKAAGMAAGYNYTDYAIDSLGVHKLFYRLRMVDIDQTASVSKIVPVDLPMPGAFAIRSVYPNPASAYINISLNSPESDNVLFTVFDVAGRPVKQQPVSITQGVQSIQINTSDLPAGVYVLRMQSRSTKQHAEVRFIKE